MRCAATRDLFKKSAEYRELLIGTLSHDIRTPLTSITTSAELLQRNLPEKQRQNILRRMRSGCRRMVNIVEQITDMTIMHMSGGIKLQLKYINFVESVQRVIEDVQIVYPYAVFQLNYDEPEIIGYWDETRIERAVMNLLTNACKHGDCTKPIIITLGERDEQANISVTNEGPPIPKEMISKLFNPLERVAEAKRTRGMGLGLYIIADMIDKHGGSINVMSTHETGTVFTVTLPKQPPA